MTVEEIKLRQMVNQHLLSTGDKLTVVKNLCGAQAQFYSNAVHALKIRCSEADKEIFSNGLAKNWTIRGTMHIFADADRALFIRCNNGQNYRKNQWNEPSFWNQRQKWSLSPERQSYFSTLIVEALSEGPLGREDLKQICRTSGMTAEEEASMFDPWGGGIRELCERGFMEYVVQEKKVFCKTPDYVPMSDDEAMLELGKRYFTNYGPATIHDAMYFFGMNSRQVKQLLDKLPVMSTICQDRTYFYIENSNSLDYDVPRCLFLAGFDPLMLGYEKNESLYLAQEDLRKIFNLAGIVMAPVLIDGHVVGKWKLKGSALTLEPFRELSSSELKSMKDKADSIWSGLKKFTIL